MFEMEAGKDVIDFIKEIEKRQCIYNVTIPEYSNRNDTKRAWCEIAEIMECTENECKEKWRKIRIAYMRSLKQMRSSNPKTKHYYLHEYLLFLMPFIKLGDTQTQEQEDSLVTMESIEYSDDEEGQLKTNEKVEVESDENNSRNIIYINDRLVDKNHEPFKSDRQRRVIENTRKRKRTDDLDDNPRKMFLLSILREVDSFSDEEMRTFRRDVINSIDNIFDKRKKNI